MDSARVIEFLTVLFLVTFLLFSPLVTLISVILLSYFWSLRLTLTVGLLYALWIYIDRHTDCRGGRWSNAIRRWALWTSFTNYFPMTLIKTEDLDPNRNYIFGYHPHGLLSLSAVGNFATDATHFSSLFPMIRPHVMLLRLQFLFPFSRELFLQLGACRVSRESCAHLLSGQHGRGHAIVIVVGGVPEMKLTQEETMIFFLQARKGFIRLALEHGASLVPVVSFGENELYRRRTLHNLVPRGMAWGRSIIGHVPVRHPVTTVGEMELTFVACDQGERISLVVGKPLHVNQLIDPSASDIDRLHQQYLQAMVQLFETNKNKHGMAHVKLKIV